MLGPCNPLKKLALSRWTNRTRDFWQILLAARGARVEHGSGGCPEGPKMILSIFIFTWTTWTTRTKAGKSTTFVVQVKGSNLDRLDRLDRHDSLAGIPGISVYNRTIG